VWKLNYLQENLLAFLSTTYQVERAKGEGFKREELIEKIIVGPDDVTIESAGISSRNARVVRERRRVTLLVGAKEPDGLEGKLSDLVPLLNKFVFEQRFPLRISISQQYDPSLRLYIAEVRLEGVIEYVMNL